MRMPNPYTPGAGDRPRALVGRTEQLALAESIRTQVEASYSANSLVYVGLRGVGKTVLLKEVSDRLSRAGWYAPHVEVRRHVNVDAALADVAKRFGALLPAGGRLRHRLSEALERGFGVQALGAGASVGARSTRSGGYGELLRVLEALAEAAREDGTGVALLVDELQSLSQTNLAALVHLVQDLRERLPFAFIGAGLPHLPAYIAKATTYAERFRYEPTDNLHDREARAAVAEPARDEGAEWEDEALDAVVATSDGYPYFLQLYAYEAWEAASRAGRVTRVTAESVHAGRPAAERQIETGIYGVRFDVATPLERQYLFTMADLMTEQGASHVRSGDVARAMGREVTALSPARESLIRNGIIHAPDHGVLRFSIPGFVVYLLRRRLDE